MVKKNLNGDYKVMAKYILNILEEYDKLRRSTILAIHQTTRDMEQKVDR